MNEPNETPQGKLSEYLLGDLGPARRHLFRLLSGELPPTPGMLQEISDSVERCVSRIERDMTYFKSESGIEIPPTENNTELSSAIRSMEVGCSIRVPAYYYNRIHVTAQREGVKVEVRREGDALRIWRTGSQPKLDQTVKKKGKKKNAK